VYLATLGSPADFTARLTFAKGFFEVAGLATVAGPVGGFAGSTASVACLCSSDARYAEAAQHAVVELEAAGARRVYVAGQGDVVAGADARAALAEVLEVMDIA
jgi:methylmalonyl-CoA mutase